MVYRKISELTKLENNPRTIRDADMALLVQSILDNGDYFEARPLILSDRTGDLVILGGNQRYEAAIIAGLKKVPTHLIKDLTEEREQEIIIRDNVNNGQWDYELLANEWDTQALSDWGVLVPSFDNNVDTNKEVDTESLLREGTVACPRCKFEFES